MVAAVWLCRLKLVLLRMELHLLFMPEPCKAKLMVELIRLEVDAAKVLEEPAVELFFSRRELQLIKLKLKMHSVVHFSCSPFFS